MNFEPVFTGRSFRVQSDLCFVLMPLKQPYHSIFEQHIKPVAESCNLRAIKADDIMSNKPVMEDVWKHLNIARIVIADLSGFNPNVFYELGIAHAIGKEVIMITSEEKKSVPFDVGHVRYVPYVYPTQMKDFESRLKETIDAVLKNSSVEVRPPSETGSNRKSSNEKPSIASERQTRVSLLIEFTKKGMDRWFREGGERSKNFDGNVHGWEVDDYVKARISDEAMKRWSCTEATADDYTKNVLLSIHDEYSNSLSQFLEKCEQQRLLEIQKGIENKIDERIRRFVNSGTRSELRKVVCQALRELSNDFRKEVDSGDWFGEAKKKMIVLDYDTFSSILRDMTSASMVNQTATGRYRWSENAERRGWTKVRYS